MTNPLAPVFEWFLQIYSIMPVTLKAYVNLSLALFVVVCLISLFFRSKH